MATARSIHGWREGKALMQRSGEDVFVSGNNAFLVKNSLDALRYLDKRSLGMEYLEEGIVYRFGFEKGSLRDKGLCFYGENSFPVNDKYLFKKRFSIDYLSDFFSSLGERDIGFTEGKVFNFFSDDGGLFLKLQLEDGNHFIANKRFHDYILKNTGADNFFVSNPIIYSKGSEVVGALSVIRE